MTDRQKRILEFIQACHDADQPPPTLREIMDALGMSSTSVVNYELDALVSAGHIQRERGSSRGIMLKGAGKDNRLTELTRSTRQLAEIVQVHQTQIADLQAEVKRLRGVVPKGDCETLMDMPAPDDVEWAVMNKAAARSHKGAS